MSPSSNCFDGSYIITLSVDQEFNTELSLESAAANPNHYNILRYNNFKYLRSICVLNTPLNVARLLRAISTVIQFLSLMAMTVLYDKDN
jgi:hypothetical protein